LHGHSFNFHIHVSVSDLYIPTIVLPILLQEICGPILGIYKSLTDTRMCKLGLRPHQFPEKENINGIFVAVLPSAWTDRVLRLNREKKDQKVSKAGAGRVGTK
jgi:hypothetical protein